MKSVRDALSKMNCTNKRLHRVEIRHGSRPYPGPLTPGIHPGGSVRSNDSPSADRRPNSAKSIPVGTCRKRFGMSFATSAGVKIPAATNPTTTSAPYARATATTTCAGGRPVRNHVEILDLLNEILDAKTDGESP